MMVRNFSIRCAKFFGAMLCCAICGTTTLGGAKSTHGFKRMPPSPNNPPPYSLSNIYLAEYMVYEDGDWVLCPTCSTDPAKHTQYVCMFTPEYLSAMYSTRPEDLLRLSIVDVSARFNDRWMGFTCGQLRAVPIINAPLVRWGPDGNGAPEAFQRLLYLCQQSNPLIQKYKTVLERNAHGTPMLPSSAIENIIQRQVARGPTIIQQENPMPNLMSLVVDVEPHQTQQHANQSVYDGGSIVLRNTLQVKQLLVRPDGSALLQPDKNVNLESCLLPFMFPYGTGSFLASTRSFTFPDYLRYRMKSLLSPWTLIKPYLLLMYQVRQAVVTANACPPQMLSKGIVKYRKKLLNATEAEIYHNLIKFKVPKTLPGSPGWHRKHLNDLLTMVDKFGMPSFFLTLTADEVSTTKWAEIKKLEELLKKINSNMTWQDNPVECATLFHKRLMHFMNTYILGAKGGILGRVTHYVIRYEIQHRGSLHAHIILWVHPDNIDQTASEICGMVPAECDPNNPKSFVEPSCPHQAALKDLVLRKNMHKCGDAKQAGCREKGPCKYLFPMDIQPNVTPVFDGPTKRYQYFQAT